MDTNKEDFDISRLKRFLWDSPNRIHNLIVTTLSILTLGIVVTLGFAMAQPKGFVQSFSETFSNIMGPVVGGVAAVFALLAFYVQYVANQLIARRQLEDDLNRQFDLYLREFRISIDQWYINPYIQGQACLKHWIDEWSQLRSVSMNIMDFIYNSKGEQVPDAVDGLVYDLSWGVMLNGVTCLYDARNSKYLGVDIGKVVLFISIAESVLRNMKNATEHFVYDREYNYMLSYGELMNSKKEQRSSSHCLLLSSTSSLSNSLKLLDNLVKLVFIDMDTRHVDSKSARSVLLAIMHGDLALLYVLYQRSRFGSSDLVKYAQAIHTKSFEVLGVV